MKFVFILAIVATLAGCNNYSSVVSKETSKTISQIVNNGRTDFESEADYRKREGVQTIEVPIFEKGTPENKWFFASYNADRDILELRMDSVPNEAATKVSFGSLNGISRYSTYHFYFENLPNRGGFAYAANVPHQDMQQYQDQVKLILKYQPNTRRYDVADQDNRASYYVARVQLLELSVVNTVTSKVYWSKQFTAQNEQSVQCNVTTGVFKDADGDFMEWSYDKNDLSRVQLVQRDLYHHNYTLTGQYEDGIVMAGRYRYDCQKKAWDGLTPVRGRTTSSS